MAAVYAAFEGPPLERTVALKILPPEFLHDETFGRRFVNEARIIASLEHPSIVPIYASGIEDGVPWISMRLLGGGTLGQLLRHGPLGVEGAVRVLADVAGALDFAHRHGVVHRDIKPNNILLDDTGRAYVGDFGLARLLEPIENWTRTGTVVGTPQYMAPEQGMTGSIDARCDTYSLGIVAYEMLIGSPPFTGDSPIAVMMQHANAVVPSALRQRCPESVYLAIEKALAKDPADRWESSSAFVNALSPGLPFHPPRRWTLVAIAAAVAIVVAIAGGLWWTRATGEHPTAQAVVEGTYQNPAHNPVEPSIGGQTPQLQDPAEPGRGKQGAGPGKDMKSRSRGQAATPPTSSAGDSIAEGSAELAVDDLVAKADPPIKPPDTTPLTQLVAQGKPVEDEPKAGPPPSPSVAIVPPAISMQTTASYPEILRNPVSAGIRPKGEVVVTLRGIVGTDGRVSDIQVDGVMPQIHATARRLLVDAATKAFSQFLFKPALQNNTPVPHSETYTFKFPPP